ncbi:Beta-galactosidase BoGH2A [Pontiella desulfatans]|uniref:Beta-galactosidase BoGH2A n=1 Tax=Pontiella desulfatans TaxID=2750659 RepID=A0A6C2UE33_PONDE|nr:glycoside hydrolase family 2 TIM barrel-domain containing protein [Pontiella desulfatans]VGO17797.1 Beta-galactosidase BoGH2A [Pontiella desulfatans]
MKRTTILALLGLALGAQAGRERMDFDLGWKFALGDRAGAEAVGYDDASWRMLNLPHDWSIEGEYDESNPMGDTCGYLPAGIGWYRKTIAVDPAWKGRHVEIAFDGVFMNSTVWANGKKLGDRPYGWISFAYDVSEVIGESDSITFAVRVDNDKQPSARWYTGSGIYAHTWLDVKEKVHVQRDGIFIRTQGDTVEVDTEVVNGCEKMGKMEIRTSIIDPSNTVIANVQAELDVPCGETGVSKQKIALSNPARWSVEHPVLYTAMSEVFINGVLVDCVTTRFGVRDVEWNPKTGLWINGKNVKLQGVCNHQDAGALGAAVPDKILRFRIGQLKAMGCNAIRTAHNPQTPVFYEICDELGMLVMDEIFDGWKRKAFEDYGAHAFDEWWERDVTDWIRRDRNHPSIVIYSVGNETHGDVAPELVAKCHEHDPTRPVTSGHSNSEDMDIVGVNGHSEKMGWFDEIGDRTWIGTENTHTWQVRGFYRTKTWFRDGFPNAKQKPYPCPDLTDEEIFTYDWIIDADRSNRKQIFNSSYDNAMVRLTARQNIEQIRDNPNYAGSFRWTGYDYIGEAGYVHGGWPFKSFMGGAIDMANFEKDLYYLYQSQWTDKPMVHMLPHWTHPSMKQGTLVPVQVYSNCDQVQLFVNGKGLDKQAPGTAWDKMQCQWMVPWQPGELKAVGTKDGKRFEETIRTAGAPAKIALSVDGEPLATQGKDIVQVRVTTQDKDGEFYPYGENRTWFHVVGAGRIKALDNGSPVDVEPHFGTDNRIAFYGLTRAYIESTGEGDVALLASCILGEKKLVYSDRVSIDARLLALRGALPKPKVEIFYTTDQSEPTDQSTPYTGAFKVEPGTTVKALVVLNGQLVQRLEERFAADEGFIWEGGGQPSGTPPGEQAETAAFKGAEVMGNGEYFRGKGFLRFGKDKGAYVEWYQENDGGAGEADLSIRYGGKIKTEKGHLVKVTVNGAVAHEELLLPNTRNPGREWAKITVPIQMGRGANTIRIEPLSGGGLCIDEILVR